MDHGRFTESFFLRYIGRDLLTQFFARFESELVAKNQTLPVAGCPDDEYFSGLGRLLLSPEGLPNGLNEVLYEVVELSSPEGHEKLKETIRDCRIEIPMDENQTREEIAMRVWLIAPEVLARKYNEQRLGRLNRFDYYEMEPMNFHWSHPRMGGKGDMDGLICSLDEWFASNGRGDETTVIERYQFKDEQWYLIRHGDSLVRSSKVEKRRLEILHYRPAKDDVVVYSPERDELRINARTKGEKELYRVLFGCFLTRYGGYFREAKTYTLEPLRVLQEDALECSDIPGLTRVVLTQLDLDLGNGLDQGYTLRADDIFACQWTHGERGLALPAEAQMKRAAFSIHIAGWDKPIEVQIRPPNTLRLARHSAAGLVHKWAAARGFKGGRPTKAKRVEHSNGEPLALL
jgi:hypothetical protein